jgi:hypothetical protein
LFRIEGTGKRPGPCAGLLNVCLSGLEESI